METDAEPSLERLQTLARASRDLEDFKNNVRGYSSHTEMTTFFVWLKAFRALRIEDFGDGIAPLQGTKED